MVDKKIMLEKKSFYMKIASLAVEICSEGEYSRKRCADYLIDKPERVDIVAKTSREEIKEEKEKGEQPLSDEYCEFVCLYRSIAEQLPSFDGFVFHGAAVEVGGRAYIFTAPSGTGKSTHVGLWREAFGEQVAVINGDKPVLRKKDGKFVVYSTAWAGKEGWHSNISAPLDAICLIRRGKENKIYPIKPSEYFDEIMGQVYIPKNSEAWLKTLSLMDELAQNTRFYLLECDISREAAELSFKTLTN